MSRGGCIRQIDCHLGVFDPPGGTGVLALHADGAITFLHIAGLVDDQNRFVVAEMIDHIGPQIVAYFVGVPLRPPKQMLQPIRAGVAAAFGQCPAVLTAQIRKQTQHQRARVPQRLTPGEPRRDPIQHLVEARTPPIDVYAMSRGDRSVFCCLHKLRRMLRSPPRTAQTRRRASIYGNDCTMRKA